jgi:uncharacterized protein (TIGR02996 family)
MPDDDGFLRALQENPNDEGTRLVYADWLEERGDLRGEYLRLDHQLSHVLTRLDELRRQIDPTWLTAVRKAPRPDGVVQFHGRPEVRIRSIRQWFTYGGLLEGLPTDRMNREMTERLLREERDKGAWLGEPYLVSPVARPIEYHHDRPYPFGTPEEFPAVTCVARLESFSPARDKTKDCSSLTAIWFQDTFAFPIDPLVLEHFRGVDWEGKAIDGEW